MMPNSSSEVGIHELRAHNRVGDYRQALRTQIRLDSIDESETLGASAAEREVQLAVALQHAGFYILAYNTYLSAMSIGEVRGGVHSALRARIELQLAVLDERLGRIDQASARLERIKSHNFEPGINIAQMSDGDWYFITRMKIHIARRDLQYARADLKNTVGTSKHFRDWAAVFDSVLKILKRGVRQADVEAVEAASSRYMAYDAPGDPWIALFAGPLIAEHEPLAGIKMMEEAAQRAERMGKFFLVAALYENLAGCYSAVPHRMADSQLAFRRSLIAYGRCQLATHLEIRSRMVRLGVRANIDAADIADIAVRSSSLLLDRSEIRLSTLLAERARRTGRSVSREFERFVEEWAPLRFAGKVQLLNPGESAADVLLVREVGGRRFGTAVQAKHYRIPKKSIPRKNPRLREVGELYGVTVDRYVFVVSTSDPRGWLDSMWHAQTTLALRNTVVDQSVDVLVITEPELQTDVVLNDHLLRWLTGGSAD